MSEANQAQPKFPALRELMRCRSVADRKADAIPAAMPEAAAYGQYRNQIAVLRAIRAHVADRGEFPRQVEVAGAMGLDIVVVAAAFQWLRSNGYIERIAHGEYRLTAKDGEPTRAERKARWVSGGLRLGRPYDHLLRGVTMAGYGDEEDGRAAC